MQTATNHDGRRAAYAWAPPPPPPPPEVPTLFMDSHGTSEGPQKSGQTVLLFHGRWIGWGGRIKTLFVADN